MSKFKPLLVSIGLSGALLTGGAMVAQQEGLILGSYVDPVGIVTACFGKTGADVELGQTYTQQQCLAMLASDLEVYNKQLLSMVPADITPSEHAAYLSFIYNVGANNFSRSTLRKKLIAGDRVGACNQLSRWIYAKGKKLQGLVNRRESERQLCLKEIVNVSND
ncbi:glycosyl hydrolase [Shewanella sp. GutCb]|uniref:lysozyme n=1 Tax=Shewanella sp. GutCb TaxID=2058315 RepID=UPI000C7D8A81|nr:lysozyme [Shewanella sp. GutCb]PKG74803.1 glycosyl hydrolase [Shewanella sp. GutCb]